MQPQKDAEVVESSFYKMWIDESGILCYVSKEHPVLTFEDSKIIIEDLKKIGKGQKRCMLIDLTNFQMPLKTSRDYAAIEFPKIIKAIGFLSRSALGRMVAN